jgi:hypothetical protein
MWLFFVFVIYLRCNRVTLELRGSVSRAFTPKGPLLVLPANHSD